MAVRAAGIASRGEKEFEKKVEEFMEEGERWWKERTANTEEPLKGVFKSLADLYASRDWGRASATEQMLLEAVVRVALEGLEGKRPTVILEIGGDRHELEWKNMISFARAYVEFYKDMLRKTGKEEAEIIEKQLNSLDKLLQIIEA